MTPAEPRQNGDTRRPRAYHRSGTHSVSRALPYLAARVADARIPADALTSIERAAREWRQQVPSDLGGIEKVSAARLALLDAAIGSKILLDSLDRYMFGLAAKEGLVNKRSRHAFGIIADRMRVADRLSRQLQALGLERVPEQAPTLDRYLAQRYAPEQDDQQEGRYGRLSLLSRERDNGGRIEPYFVGPSLSI